METDNSEQLARLCNRADLEFWEEMAEFGATVLRILSSVVDDELGAAQLNGICDVVPPQFKNADGTLRGLWSTEPAVSK